jgi:hypothetical protein
MIIMEAETKTLEDQPTTESIDNVVYQICLRIVSRRQAEEFQGMGIDMQSANLYCKIYDGLSPKNKKILVAQNLLSQFAICWTV